jgi:hypothetical protein
MSEQATPAGTEHEREASEPARTSAEETQKSGGHETPEATQPEEKIIWTPGFFLTFALILVLGLSAESLFTLGWQNGILTSQWWCILAHVILNGSAWLALGIVTRSRWIRLGCIFGGLWTLFMGLNIFTNVQGLDPNAPLQSYINVAICMALLGAYLGLSIEGTLLTRWDAWLFLLVPILSACGVTLTYLLTPQASILTSENALAASALIACCLFWWLRPSCWRKWAGPTFIFGLAPLIMLIAAASNSSMHDFFLLHVTNIHSNPRPEANNLFFAQVILLSLLLGCIRLIKSEKAN